MVRIILEIDLHADMLQIYLWSRDLINLFIFKSVSYFHLGPELSFFFPQHSPLPQYIQTTLNSDFELASQFIFNTGTDFLGTLCNIKHMLIKQH